MEPEQNVEGGMAEVDVAEMMGFSSFGRKRKHADSPIASRPAPDLPSANPADLPHPAGIPSAGPASLPARPPPGAADEHRAPASGPSRHQGRIWWVGYYDPTSNENPWEILERKGGLEAIGAWLPRGHARRGQHAEGAQESSADAPAGPGEGEGGE